MHVGVCNFTSDVHEPRIAEKLSINPLLHKINVFSLQKKEGQQKAEQMKQKQRCVQNFNFANQSGTNFRNCDTHQKTLQLPKSCFVQNSREQFATNMIM